MAKLTVSAVFGGYRPGFIEKLLEAVDVVLVFRDASPAVQEWLKEQGYAETMLKGCWEHKDATGPICEHCIVGEITCPYCHPKKEV